MEENKPLEVDVVSPQEGRNVSEEIVEEGFGNVFTEQKYSTKREAVDSYDALNKGFMIIDDIKSDFGRMSNPTEVAVLQEELKKLMPRLELQVNGVLNLETERALREYERLVGLI